MLETTTPLDRDIARSVAHRHTVGACSWRRLRLFDQLDDSRFDRDTTTAAIADWSEAREVRRLLDGGELADDVTPYEEERALRAADVAAYDDDALLAYLAATQERLEAGWAAMDAGGERRYFGAWWRLLARYELAHDELEARRARAA